MVFDSDMGVSDALSSTPELTPEAKRFISGQSADPKRQRASGKSDAKKNSSQRTESDTSSGTRASKKPDLVEERVLKPLSTRIEKSLKEKLDEAVFKRKAAMQKIWRQQDIVEQAILEWLKSNPI